VVDRIDKEVLSLGTSYLRYWLPIYIISLPFLAMAIAQTARLAGLMVKDKIGVQIIKISVSAGLIILLLWPSVNLVTRETDESLFLLKNLNENRIKSELINKIVKEEDIVIMYKQADKIFFPARKKLITELAVAADYLAVKRLSRLRDIYYYTFAPASTVEFISRRDFEPYGLKITEGKRVLGQDWIYKISNF
jgi:hypothetical protein